jgi:putative transposase
LNPFGEDKRKGSVRKIDHRFTDEEKKQIISVACSPEFRDSTPEAIVAILASRSEYIGSESSFRRFLKTEELNRHRRREKAARHHRPKHLVATGPGQIWTWDITYLRSKVLGSFFYCYVFVDIFSRKIVAYDVHPVECGKIASELFSKACEVEGVQPGDLTLHSDNGASMKSAEFLATLSKLGVEKSFSRPSVSNDNPFSEAIFKTMKYRTWYPEKPFGTLEDARKWMSRFANWYNFTHLHSGIKLVTPDQRHRGEDIQILETRHATYEEAKKKNPARWTGETRDWSHIKKVDLNQRPAA